MESESGPLNRRVFDFFFAPDSKFVRVFRHRDFRIMWMGAFLSFVGSWVQNVGQGFLVYDITQSKEKLALISFCGMVPVTFLGPFGGSIVDRLDRRKLLIWTQVLLALGAFVVFFSYLYMGRKMPIEILVVVALLGGTVSCLEMPARQLVIADTIPREDLPVAIPFQGLTFNLARVVGPAIGGILLAKVGVQACYLVNGLSFAALVLATLAIRTNLSSQKRQIEPIGDLLKEGYLYTMHEPRLKALFYLETGVSLFALFYLVQLPALAKDILHLGTRGVGDVYTAVGVGSILALTLTAKTADLHIKGLLVRGAITAMALGLAGLALLENRIAVFGILVMLGMASVTLFNTCNSLFQLIAPERLRGRVLSMHIWALSGVGPLGVYPFGLLAEHFGLTYALGWSAGLTGALAIAAWSLRLRLESE
jgi:MFS family permease